ncbi:MAG: PEP-CTERM sorting domain-containing protein [Phycisphaerae bacterium]
MYTKLFTIATVSLLVLSTAASASVIVYGTNADHSLEEGANLSDVRLEFDLSVSGGKATATFTNVSTNYEASAVFKEIVLDVYNNDTDQAVLWNPVVLTDTDDVDYSYAESNGLPAYHDPYTESGPVAATGGSNGRGNGRGKGKGKGNGNGNNGGSSAGYFGILELQAEPSPERHGIAPGEFLKVEFETLLAEGSTEIDYLNQFVGGPNESPMHSVGFHAISADVVDGESLTGSLGAGGNPVPEPTTLAILGGGAAIVLTRRKRKRTA